jgi:hypothetical protein
MENLALFDPIYILLIGNDATFLTQDSQIASLMEWSGLELATLQIRSWECAISRHIPAWNSQQLV